ncbi:MAG: CoA ester lyase [Alphaproteobacteria bacterium]|nr:CoA ester lyase [Alphaproteobacteria bacterium]
MTMSRRPVALRRSWLFVPGADTAALGQAADSEADVAIQELEDFTAPDRRPAARALARDTYARWRQAGLVAAVRVNPLGSGDGMADLEAAMAARPDAVLLPKVDRPAQVVELAACVERLERAHGMAPGSTELVPNVESARGLVAAVAIASASPRVVACLMASEDLAADLGAERGRDALELAHARARFHVDCVAAGVLSIDCPYTWRDVEGAVADTLRARRLGYRAKSLVVAEHARPINAVLTPAPAALAQARRVIAAFDQARLQGLGGVELDGSMVELPIYLNAKRLVARAEAFGLA